MMTKREAVRAILDGTGADRIPVIMNIVSLSAERYGYTMMDIMMSPEKFAECVIGTRRKLGYDGLCGGLMVGQTGDIAGHLPNSEGQISMDGNDTIHSFEDLEKLKEFDISQCKSLKWVEAIVNIMRKEEPEEPIYVIMYPPTGMAFNLMGAKPAFRAMVKNQELFRAVSEKIEDMNVELGKALIDMGVDFLWFPTPNFGGFCISKKTYKDCISESNIRFYKKLRDYGGKIVLHTCGLYDDRFDQVIHESGHAWHIADTQTKKVKDLYGKQVSIMGNIPCVSVLLNGSEQDVYDYTYQDCLDGAYDGRMILSGDCDVAPPTPDENIMAAVRAAKDAEKVLFGKAE